MQGLVFLTFIILNLNQGKVLFLNIQINQKMNLDKKLVFVPSLQVGSTHHGISFTYAPGLKKQNSYSD